MIVPEWSELILSLTEVKSSSPQAANQGRSPNPMTPINVIFFMIDGA